MNENGNKEKPTCFECEYAHVEIYEYDSMLFCYQHNTWVSCTQCICSKFIMDKYKFPINELDEYKYDIEVADDDDYDL